MSWERIKYFSKYDGAGFSYLEKAKEILICFDEKKAYPINDLIEFYQIKLYIDNEVFLAKWTHEEIENYKSISKKMWTVIVRFWQKINDSNLVELFESLECWTVQDSFWELTAILSAYKQITGESFASLINLHKIDLRAILYQTKIVSYYGEELRGFLLTHKDSAELILSQYVQKHDRIRKSMYFPKCLSLKDKEDIISRYLDDKDANLNYVRLVLNIKKLDMLDVSDKTRLKAKRLEGKLNNQMLDLNGGIHVGVDISFSGNQQEPIIYSLENHIQSYSYSTKHIFQINNPVYYLSHFRSLFQYLDDQLCVSMVSRKSDIETLEKIFMTSQNEYQIGMNFRKKDSLSFGQLFLYDSILTKAQKQNVEQLVKYYIGEYISEAYNLKGFRFNLPSSGTNYLEKIRVLLAEFDVLLRQYKIFFEDGEIDYELLQISSTPYSFSQIPSFVPNKYCYSKSSHFEIPFYLLFSDQSNLCYVNPFKKSCYHCLYDLILSENVLFENYEKHQVKRINLLIDEGYLLVDENGIIRFKNNDEIFVIKQLYENEVLSYWHYSQPRRNIIDEMVKQDILYFETTLFNKSECDYFNYYLNKKEFTNGLDLRNNFMHGTNTDSEDQLKKLYYIILRIIILAILKIDDDQILNQQQLVNKIETVKFDKAVND